MLVPADAHLPMAHNDADARNASSAMSPGTLMLAGNMLRRLILVQWAFIIVAVVIDVIFAEYVYPHIMLSAISELEERNAHNIWFIFGASLVIVSMLGHVIGSILLFLGRRRGFYIYSISQIACLVSTPFLGYYTASGLGGMLIDSAMITIGATILYAYLTLVKRPC